METRLLSQLILLVQQLHPDVIKVRLLNILVLGNLNESMKLRVIPIFDD